MHSTIVKFKNYITQIKCYIGCHTPNVLCDLEEEEKNQNLCLIFNLGNCVFRI